jgi:hypothetical protein
VSVQDDPADQAERDDELREEVAAEHNEVSAASLGRRRPTQEAPAGFEQTVRSRLAQTNHKETPMTPAKIKDDTRPIRIAVLQRGWVVVGRHSKDGEIHRMEDANVVRRWGTTQGLGQIAQDGPTTSTVLDPCPPITVHELTIVLLMECEARSWSTKLRR